MRRSVWRQNHKSKPSRICMRHSCLCNQTVNVLFFKVRYAKWNTLGSFFFLFALKIDPKMAYVLSNSVSSLLKHNISRCWPRIKETRMIKTEEFPKVIFIFSGYTYLASSLVFTTVRRLFYLLIQASITILFKGSFRDSF